jgi:hypothetical protein
MTRPPAEPIRPLAARPLAARSLAALPKAHLHLHFTGAMRHATLVELADRHGIRLPEALTAAWPPRLSAADERGWFRFQRLYDTARSVLRTPEDVYRLLRETAEDERAEGSRPPRPGSASASSSRPTGPSTRWRRGPWPGWPPSTPGAA